MAASSLATKEQLEALVVRLGEASRRLTLVEQEVSSPPPATNTSTPAAGQAPAPPQAEEANGSAPTLETIVDQLNALRAGKSLKDGPVKDQLQRYFEGLSDAEKTAMYTYVKGLAQVVSGQVDAGSAEAPKEAGVETSTTGKHSRTIKPNVVRRSPEQPKAVPASTTLGPPAEDRSAPMPIVPKKR